MTKPSDERIERVARAIGDHMLNMAKSGTRPNIKETPVKLAQAALEAGDSHLAKENERLKWALDQCFVGGNHLASMLIDSLGADFAEKYPYDLDAESAMRMLNDTQEHEIWVAWSCIMTAREALHASEKESGMVDIHRLGQELQNKH